MRIKLLLLSVIVLAACRASSQNFGGNPASLKWKQVNTAAARVIFPAGLDSQAIRINQMIKLLNETTVHTIGDKVNKWNVVLQAQTTESNAYVRLAPVLSELYMMPPQNSFLFGSIRWDDNLIIHENRHMQQFSNFNKGFTKVFSFLFGQEGQLLANGIAIPDYFFEGDAVWQETLVSRQGRGRMPSFYNGMKSLWLANKKFSWMQIRNGSLRHYYPDHYELGYPVVLYGYARYGEDFWRKVTEDAVRFKGLFYSFNKAIQKYSGLSYASFTKEALAYYREQTMGSVASDNLNFITPAQKNNVVDYFYPQYVNDDTIVVTRQSFKELNSFYLLINGKEQKLRVKDYVLDDYFSCRNGSIVYAAYQSDPRWTNRNYSVIKKLNIYTGEQVQLSNHTKYFSPDISPNGKEIIAVKVNEDGSSVLVRLNADDGQLISTVPNPENYFFTQTKYINAGTLVSAVRNAKAEMALIKINIANGSNSLLTEFSNNITGYPTVAGDMIYFSMTDNYSINSEIKPADRIFAVSTDGKQLYRITKNINGVYQPAVNSKGEMIFTAFTADGSRLARLNVNDPANKSIVHTARPVLNHVPAAQVLLKKGAAVSATLAEEKLPVERYRKSFKLFNFHSARPFADDPEYGYTFYSDNTLSSFKNEITYTYNRNEQSHAVAYNLLYAGAFPYLRAGVERSFNRKIDTGNVSRNEFNYHSTKMNVGINLPLSFINGRTFKFLNIGGGFNTEYVPYRLVGKDVQTRALNYMNAYFVFSNTSRKPKQFINPAWAQQLTVTYRDAFNIIDNKKLVADAALFFPGLFPNHSIVIDGAYQHRDTLPDFFSKTFSFARGYQDLNQRRMYKWGVNYHIPICYPDWGFGNMIFFQRIRLNAFYDYGSSLTKFSNGRLIDIKTRSTGAELYFDTKVWNALPVSFGVRYSRLLDWDYLNPGAVNRWEIILPIGLIPE